MDEQKIIMLIGEGSSSTFMYNALKNDFVISAVVVDGKVDRKKFLTKRIKKMGFFTVFGQILFQMFVPKILKMTSQKRINQIKSIYQLEDTPILFSTLKKVQSVNSKECINFLKKENPTLIIVNGTRIISKEVLNCTKATFINTHAGITPKYRGVHGGYWSIANNDRENCGVTVHLVDRGIDTGAILFQQIIATNSKDNFVTYTYLQIGEGIQLMKKAIADFMNGNLKEKKHPIAESKLWYHPTLWFYLKKWLLNGVK